MLKILSVAVNSDFLIQNLEHRTLNSEPFDRILVFLIKFKPEGYSPKDEFGAKRDYFQIRRIMHVVIVG
jgi:hypothetical protein